jgi:hypothetical protein
VIRGGLISEKMREAALHSYEIVLRALESAEMSGAISASGKLPPEKIRPAAQKIVEFLLFEKKSNPFASLGLSPFATTDDIHHRWKRLIAIYHPDRRPGEKDPLGEEAAKKINEAYKNAMDIKALKPARSSFAPERASQKNQADTAKKRTIRAKPAKKRFFFESLFRPSSIFLALGIIVMLWAMASICLQVINSTSVKKAATAVRGQARVPAREEKFSGSHVTGMEKGNGRGWPVLMENNAPWKTYLILPAKTKESGHGIYVNEAGRKKGKEAGEGEKNAAGP